MGNKCEMYHYDGTIKSAYFLAKGLRNIFNETGLGTLVLNQDMSIYFYWKYNSEYPEWCEQCVHKYILNPNQYVAQYGTNRPFIFNTLEEVESFTKEGAV